MEGLTGERVWIKLGSLVGYCLLSEPSFPLASVFTMVTIDGEWNWSMFAGELPHSC